MASKFPDTNCFLCPQILCWLNPLWWRNKSLLSILFSSLLQHCFLAFSTEINVLLFFLKNRALVSVKIKVILLATRLNGGHALVESQSNIKASMVQRHSTMIENLMWRCLSLFQSVSVYVKIWDWPIKVNILNFDSTGFVMQPCVTHYILSRSLISRYWKGISKPQFHQT